MFVYFEMPNFRISLEPFEQNESKIWQFKINEQIKIGHFKKITRDENSNKKDRETESIRILGISK